MARFAQFSAGGRSTFSPFWEKPAAVFLAAGGVMSLLGVNEFAARLSTRCAASSHCWLCTE